LRGNFLSEMSGALFYHLVGAARVSEASSPRSLLALIRFARGDLVIHAPLAADQHGNKKAPVKGPKITQARSARKGDCVATPARWYVAGVASRRPPDRNG
jgi:hypothetical protein